MTSHKIIKASAGSGKTFRLSLRYIALISTNPDPTAPARILATTFSRKAAAEILERVLLRLSEACLDQDKSRQLSRELQTYEHVTVDDFGPVLLKVAGVLHRLQVATLDGYFARLASVFRNELDLPPASAVMEEENAVVEPIKLQAITDVLESIKLEDILGLLQRVHHDELRQSVLDSLKKLVGEVYAVYKAEPDKNLWTALQTGAPERTEEEINLLLNRLRGFASSTKDKRLAAAVEKVIDNVLANLWDELAGQSIIGNVLDGNPVYYKKPLPDDLLAILETVIEETRVRVTRQVASQTLATYQWASLYAHTFDKTRRDRGLVFYSDIPQALRNKLIVNDEAAINLSEEIYYRLDARTQHLLLDEFQDTSLDQWRVLKPTAEEIVSQGGQDHDGSDTDGNDNGNANASKSQTLDPTADRSVLIVGDVKQAIYGWRGGCAEIFDTVREQLQLPTSVIEPLTESYRSSQVVLDAVNAVFSGLTKNHALNDLKEDEDEAQAVKRTVERWHTGFDTHKAHRNLPGHVCFEVMKPGTQPEADGQDQESDGVSGADSEDDSASSPKAAAQAAEAIARLRNKHPERSIGVLVSSNKFGFEILGELRRLGVEASGETGVRIADDPAVGCMLAGLKLADHPGDTIAGFHVFNSPLAAAAGLASRKPEDLGRFSSQTREEIAQEGIAGLLARWTGLIAPSCNEDNLRRLWQLVQFAQDQESLGFGRLSAFVQSVTQAQVQEPTPAKVRVMTIYKSKGLEFDIVVMPQLDKQLARVEKLCLVLRDSPASPARAVFRSVKKEVRKLMPEEVNEAYLAELSSRLTDDLCCLYVGMTRARYALHLLAPVAKQTKAGAAVKPRASYLTVLEAAFSIDHDQTLNPGALLYQIGNPDWDDKAVSDISAPTSTDHQVSAMSAGGLLLPKLKAVGTSGRSLPSVSPSSLEDGASVRVADLLALEKPVNRRRGTLFHRWFEQIDYLSPGAALPTAEQLRACAADLTLGVPEEDLSQWLSLFLKSLDNPVVIHALGKPAPDGGLTVELWREHDFVVYDEGKILRGQFDRVLTFRDASGKQLKAELLDFKTDRVTDENVGQVVAGYRPQINAYIRGLSRLLGLDESAITGRLLFVGGEPRVEVISG